MSQEPNLTEMEPTTPIEVFVQIKKDHIEKVVEIAKRPGVSRIYHRTESHDYPFRRKLVIEVQRTWHEKRQSSKKEIEKGAEKYKSVECREITRILNCSDHTIRSEDDPRWEAMLNQFGIVFGFLERIFTDTFQTQLRSYTPKDILEFMGEEVDEDFDENDAAQLLAQIGQLKNVEKNNN